MRAVQRLVPTLLVAAGLGACSGGDVQQPQISIAAVVSSVTLDGEGTQGTLEQSALPAEGAAPALNVSSPAAAINGGSFLMSVTSAEPFSEVVLGLQSAPDYYKVVLPAPATSAGLLVTLDPGAPEGSLTLYVVGGTSPTQYGPVLPRSMSVLRVGSGDVQVSVAWNSAADVDLHVIDPSGEEIYYGSRSSTSGGELDLDSNAACASDQPRNENTVWPTGEAPTGTYTVRLDYWDACNALQTDYVVTVWVKGQEPKVFSGTFTGEGEHGGAGSGIDITTFNR
jgi:hypothetical protein